MHQQLQSQYCPLFSAELGICTSFKSRPVVSLISAPAKQFANVMKITTHNLVLMAAFAATIAIFSSVAAASVYECDYVNECGLDVHVEVSPSYKSKYGYKGVDRFYLHDKASKLVSYTLEKLFYPFDLGGIFWNVKAIVDGEELVASCYLPLDARVVITKRNEHVCAEVYVYRKILHKYIISSVVYLQ